MENHQIDANNKRRHSTNDEDPSPKSQCKEKPVNEVMPPTKIIDLNDDCLEKVFNHLDVVENLFNVAAANGFLVPAAAIVYKRKFGAKSVAMNAYDDLRTVRTRCIKPVVSEDVSGVVHVNGLKTCLQYLRLFGSSIPCLLISDNGLNRKRCQYVVDYVTKYCAGNLASITLRGLAKCSMPHFAKPFENVTKINFENCDLGKHLPSFAELCPNIRILSLCGVRFNGTVIFHQLQHLSIDDQYDRYRDIKKNAAAGLLRANPQLQSIELVVENMRDMPMTNLLQIIKSNAAITKLNVPFRYSGELDVSRPSDQDRNVCLVNSAEVEQIVNEHPSLIELYLYQYEITVPDAIKMVQQLSALKKFTFRMSKAWHRHQLEWALDSEWNVTHRMELNYLYYHVRLNRKN